MTEENTRSLDADSTNPLPLEQFIRQHIAMLLKQGDELREQMSELREQMSELREQMSELREQQNNLGEQQVRLQEQQTNLAEQQVRLQEQQNNLGEQQNTLREEMVGRFEQLSQQNLRLESLGLKIREDIRDLDYKVGPFIKEQINLKRSLDEVREHVGLETY
jgi:chromosome segregation ATPase